ncbi:uncharacterized protein LOC129411848 [Boleophthalmus pectinirostris]|uniref:uncharacterized protein LOC129411848 n=1 Tax=Boleophthalmus pectinirostris TaxID=150288 RepID=UPI00242D5935|nr:uncharacterized protein LOC129411848 [Boleophthalmus pectinirostris]
MDSQLATVLTSGSLNVQNGSQCTQISGPLSEVCLEPEGEETSSSTVPGNLQPCPVQIALTIRQDSLSINGKKPEGGGTSKPASHETSKSGGFREPITVKTGVPILRREPIRIRIVAPPQCKRPITASTLSLTKDLTLSRLKKPAVVPAGDQNTTKSQTSVNSEPKIKMDTQKPGQESLKSRDTVKKIIYKEKDLCQDKNNTDALETLLISSNDTVKILTQCKIKEEPEEDLQKNIPIFWERMPLNGLKINAMEIEEQTEPLDLSLPKKRERRYGRLLEDWGESSLIMEVDEYEGEGDRDIVEDDSDLEVFCTNDLQLSPSIFDSSIDCNTEDLLLIDDQGIPYTLSPDGHKLPQVDISKLEQMKSVDEDGQVLSTEEVTSHSHNIDNEQIDASFDKPVDETPPPSLTPQLEENPSEDTTETQPHQEVQPPSAVSLLNQPIQILTNSTNNTPIVFLTSSSSSVQTPISLSLPFSQAPSSTPMLLLLSPVAPSAGEATATSTPIAVLDPTTGQISQIATAAPLGQMGATVSPLSHPVIRLSPSNPQIILSGNTVLSSLSVHESSLQMDQNTSSATLSHNPISSSESTPSGNQAIFSEDTEDKPSTAGSAPAQPPALNLDSSSQPGNEAVDQSPSTDTKPDLSDPKFELNDHLYYNCAAPPSPSLMCTTKLEPMDQVDPLSPDWTPDGQGARRVLYCQLCPRVFFYMSDLERHAITHSQKKPHVCPQCGKAFKRSSHLQRHKHIHTGQRNYVCPICAKRFREAGELQRHQRVHTGEKPYQCQLCHTRFAERNTLRRHTKRKHPYHQVAMEMLSDKKNGGGKSASAVQEEESAEWYSSSVSHMDNSESEAEA